MRTTPIILQRPGRVGVCLRDLVLLLALALFTQRISGQPLIQLGTNFVAQGHTVQLPLWMAGATDLAGFQADLIFDTGMLASNGFSVTTPLPGMLADGGIVASNRLRVILLSSNSAALPPGLVASLRFVIQTNAPNGLRQMPMGPQPGGVGITFATNGTCGSALAYRAGELFVGDAFGFVPGGGRAQFRTTDGAGYVIVAISDLDTNLANWTPVGTNFGMDGLVFWIDRDVTNYSRRFYHLRAR